jgi:hypothetical protein
MFYLVQVGYYQVEAALEVLRGWCFLIIGMAVPVASTSDVPLAKKLRFGEFGLH